MTKCGFTITDAQLATLTNDRLIAIRDVWGFSHIMVVVMLGQWLLENTDAGGNNQYNTTRRNNLRAFVDRAMNQKMTVTINTRVQMNPDGAENRPYTDWRDPTMPTPTYVNMTIEGRTRFAEYWKWMATQFPECNYCIWHFPYHMGGGVLTADNAQEIMTTYHNVTAPLLCQRIREVSPNEIIYVPVIQAESSYFCPGGTMHTCFYRTLSANWGLTPLKFSNITYSCGHLIDQNVVFASNADGKNPSRTQAFYDDIFAGIDRWKSLYDQPNNPVKWTTVEAFGLFHPPKGYSLTSERVTYLEEVLKRCLTRRVAWIYWWLDMTEPSPDSILDTEAFVPNATIMPLLQQYKVPDEFVGHKLRITATVGGTTDPSPGEYTF